MQWRVRSRETFTPSRRPNKDTPNELITLTCPGVVDALRRRTVHLAHLRRRTNVAGARRDRAVCRLLARGVSERRADAGG